MIRWFHTVPPRIKFQAKILFCWSAAAVASVEAHAHFGTAVARKFEGMTFGFTVGILGWLADYSFVG
jgi:hypothetical protein